MNLTWCLALTNRGLIEGICQSEIKLTFLGLFGNTTITVESVEALAKSPCALTLETFDINGCKQIELEKRQEEYLREYFIHCKEFIYHS